MSDLAERTLMRLRGQQKRGEGEPSPDLGVETLERDTNTRKRKEKLGPS
jgi:hypothetical protein